MLLVANYKNAAYVTNANAYKSLGFKFNTKQSYDCNCMYALRLSVTVSYSNSFCPYTKEYLWFVLSNYFN